MQRRQQGFTLIELMIVVAIVGILASLAVYMFGNQRKRVEAMTEVSAVFSELKIRLEQYKVESGRYISTGANETSLYPIGAPATDGGKVALPAPPTPGPWAILRFNPDFSAVRCGYVVITGDGGDNTNIGPMADVDFAYTAPATDWYYLLARCDMDQSSSALDSYYFQHSQDSTIFYKDQGR